MLQGLGIRVTYVCVMCVFVCELRMERHAYELKHVQKL